MLVPEVKDGAGIQGDKSQVKGQTERPKSRQMRRSGTGAGTQNTVMGTFFLGNSEIWDCMGISLKVTCHCDCTWLERGSGRFC